jgi:glycosyltransferase involved in cell wall biosynthesis
VLARVEPWVRDSLPEGRLLLDSIDSLAMNARERARHSPDLMRWIWRIEQTCASVMERATADEYERVLFVSDAEAEACGTKGLAISNGVRIRPLEPGPRRYDFGFWGRLAYFANADAARWLLEQIWPAIRAAFPSATLAIAGADAPSWLRHATRALAGVTLLSPVEDMALFARNVRVAILPLRYGSGESTKMLEAAEAGCAVVARPRGVRSLNALAPHVIVADDATALANAAVMLLQDDARRTSLSNALRSTVSQHYSRESTLARLVAVARGAAA